MWTAEDERILSEMWRQGVVVSVIAQRLNRGAKATHNRALSRPDLCPPRGKGWNKALSRGKSGAPSPRIAERLEAQAEKHEYDATALNVSMTELKPGMCKWPVNNAAKGDPHLFCGHETEKPGSSWCKHHGLRLTRPTGKVAA
ncbi:GcrA family cell cycle regulator [Zhengella sp. ZM62]|uniref:GcrA family cell cycle regulator n=1 Tax=Zhengella sedimenti TaxID=3390035 RepID=UPI0039764012